MKTLDLEYRDGGSNWHNPGYYGTLDLDDGRELTVKILHDDCNESPREWSTVGTMVCWHRDYNLGDEQPSGDPDEYMKDLALSFDDSLYYTLEYWEDGNGWAMLYNRYLDTSKEGAWDALRPVYKEQEKRAQAAIGKVLDKHLAAILPLHLYDHSGITMSTGPFSCPWDSGQVGWIYITKEQIRKEWNVKRVSKKKIQWAEERCKGEVEAYDHYLTGNVWSYSIEVTRPETCEYCECTETVEDIEERWGFYGSPTDKDSYLVEEINRILEDLDVKIGSVY